MIVVGIDPGSLRTGWGAVRREGSRLLLLEAGVLRPAGNAPLERRLAGLHEEFAAVLARVAPDAVAVESVFHGVNTRSLVTLGQARGALLAAIGAVGAPCIELAPARIKKALTGKGSATKEQVAHMVSVLLGGGTDGLSLDATDALAAAIAAIHGLKSARSAPVAEG